MTTKTQTKPQLPPHLDAPTATLLLVDDEPNILRSLRRVFRPDGYRILMAESGAEGLKMLATEPIDLVISDMRMPEMDGATFLKHVAADWPDVMRLLLTGYAEVESAVAAINDGKIYRYFSKPWDDDDLRLNVKSALDLRRLELERKRLEALTQTQNDALTQLNASLEDQVTERTRALRATLVKLKESHINLKDGYVQSIHVFSRMIDMRSDSKVSTRKLAEQAHQVALDLGLSEADAQDVLFAALLRELGKIGFSDALLNKPQARLDPDELTRYERYPIDGQAALMSLEALQGAALLIRTHREHMDGSGFPDGISGDSIPLGARVLAVISGYHALLNGQTSRTPMSNEATCTHLLSHRGSHYDPTVVDAFLGRYGVPVREMEDEPDILVALDELTSGMILNRDILSADGMVWLPRGQVLNNRLINRIKEIGATTVRPPQVYVRFQQMP